MSSHELVRKKKTLYTAARLCWLSHLIRNLSVEIQNVQLCDCEIKKKSHNSLK